MKSIAAEARRLVVKVGSSLVTNEGQGLDHAALARWAGQIAGQIEGARSTVLPDPGHCPQIEQSAAVNDLLLEFLADAGQKV